MKEEIASKIIFITKDNLVIGKKIIRHNAYLPEYYTKDENNWIPVWHRTEFKSLKSIMKHCLKLPGTKLENGLEIKPLENHMNRYVTVNNIEDWAKAIFVSPSIFYSANAAYAKVIQSIGKEWLILIEARTKIGSYVSQESTVFNYEFMEENLKMILNLELKKNVM